MRDIEDELTTLREQLRRSGPQGQDAIVPDLQEIAGETDGHI